MVKFMILFKNATQTGTFEMHFTRNLSLLKKMPGVQEVWSGSVLGGPMGSTAYHRVVEVTFENFEAMDAALTSPEGVTAGKDLIGFVGNDAEILFVGEPADSKPQPLTPDNLQAYLDSHDIPAEIVFPGRPTPSVISAANALGVEPDQIVKSMLFMVDGRPFLVYGCGMRRVDPHKLAARLNVERRAVRVATADEVLDITGFQVGAVPPLGFKTAKIPTYMDPAIQEHEIIYAGGGGRDALLKIRSEDLLRLSNAEVAPMLHETPKPKASVPASEDEPAATTDAEADSGADTPDSADTEA